jgi:UDP-glucuronate 4-epimerase
MKDVKKKILVTGAAGFIGSKLAQQLAGKNFDVVGLDNINDYYDIRLKEGRLESLTGIAVSEIKENELVQSRTHPNYRFVKMDIRDNDHLQSLFKNEQFEWVCHLAAQAGVRNSITNPYEYIYSNINGFLNILEACRNNPVEHLVYASSSSVYGLNEKVPFTEKDPVNHPISLYAATKKANELMAHSYSHLFRLPTTGLRFFTVYGPWGRPDMAPFLFTDSISKSQPIHIFNNGNMLRDFTFIDDVVNGIMQVMESPAKANPEWNPQNPEPDSSSAPYRIYNIGNSNPVKLMDFIHLLENEIGKEAEKIFLPMQAGDVYQTNADTISLQQTFNIKPATEIAKGISAFVSWYKSFY